jgi:hypothetical protein
MPWETLDLVTTRISAGVTLEIAHGSLWNDTILIEEFIDEDTLAPLDLTGVTFRLVIRPRYAHEELIYMLSTEGATIITDADPTTGLITLTLDVGVIDSLPPGDWRHILTAYKGLESRELARGHFIIHPGPGYI